MPSANNSWFVQKRVPIMPDVEQPSFLSSNEIAQLLGISRQAVSSMAAQQNWQFKPWAGQGHSKIYLFQSMPAKLQEKLLKALPSFQVYRDNNPATLFGYKSEKEQSRALRRYRVMMEFIALVDAGIPIGKAIKSVAQKNAINPANIRNWYYGTTRKIGLKYIDRKQWLFALAGNKSGPKRTYAYFSHFPNPDTQIGNGE